MLRKDHSGFTLIELMVVVAIIGILMAVVIPNYQEHVRRANRVAAQNYLADLGQRQELLFQNNRAYSATAADFPARPADVARHYSAPTFTVVAAAAGVLPTYTITLAPITTGSMSADGSLVMQSDGLRYRELNGTAGYQSTGDKLWDSR